MSKRILITGGSGFIGSHLTARWLAEGHEIVILSRRPDAVARRWEGRVTAVSELTELEGRFDWLINLAGEGIADQRWSDSRKEVLRDSRVALTERLGRWAQSTDQQFEVVLSGSAIGYYGGFPGAQPALTESSSAGKDFAANLCIDWENAAALLAERAERLVYLRTGVVLGARQGMLARMWLPFRLGLGGPIGSGQQVISWIHIEDYCRAVDFILKSSLTGPINMTAPEPVANARFSRQLAGAMSRPACLPMPSFVTTLVFGELSELLLKGQNVIPKVLSGEGFSWVYSDSREALEAVVRVW